MIADRRDVGGFVEQLERREPGGDGDAGSPTAFPPGRPRRPARACASDPPRRPRPLPAGRRRGSCRGSSGLRCTPEKLLRPAARDAESADHLVEHQQRSVRRSALAQQLEEALSRGPRRPCWRAAAPPGSPPARSGRSRRSARRRRSTPTTTVLAAAPSGTPRLAGSAWVARPEPASASRPSTCPW